MRELPVQSEKNSRGILRQVAENFSPKNFVNIINIYGHFTHKKRNAVSSHWIIKKYPLHYLYL
jgi:hypothetical protein